MKKHLPFLLLIVSSISALATAQAPIVRQPPSTPPDQQTTTPSAQQAQQDQQAQPDGQAAPAYPEQAPPPADQAPPPPLAPQQLDQLVQRIALYPDPLLAQVLTASTFYYQVADAATWANQHGYLHGDPLAQAIQADNLPWDPSVLALLPFPSVLDMMARDPRWTGDLGNAVLNQRPDVMDAVQRERQIAHNYGYLAPNQYDDIVDNGGYLEIDPLNPSYLYVPVYNPAVVFYAPRPGFFVGGAIGFGPAIVIGPRFGIFGWYGAGFGWGAHSIFIDHRPWGRTYGNRGVYVHPYAHPYVHAAGPRVETHGGRRR